MSKVVELFPYAFSTQLTSRLTDFDDPVNGSSVEVLELGQDEVENGEIGPENSFAYDASNSSWQKLTFRIDVQLPEAERSRILPDTSDLERDTALIVLMTCRATRVRHGVRLKPMKNYKWSGHVTIQRQDLQGLVTFSPQLVRTTGIPSGDELPFATQAGTLIATGAPLTLYVDPSPVGGIHSTVVIRWEDFPSSENPWRREHPDDVFHLEPFSNEPRLYLNSRYAQLREIMESDAKRGFEAVLRDMNAVMIAQPVLMQLAMASIASLELDDDSDSVTTPSGWRADILASVLPRLYPEAASDEDRIRRAAAEIQEADSASSQAGRLGSVVQDMLASYKTVEGAIRVYETSRDQEEIRDD
jgi:hypothetical protein